MGQAPTTIAPGMKARGAVTRRVAGASSERFTRATAGASSAHAASHVSSRLPVYDGPFTAVHAERLLWRAGFGPKPGQARKLAKLGMRGAVLSLTRPKREALVGPAPVLETGEPIDPYNAWGDDVLWWLDRMVRSTAPLVERMTLNWHDWFATSNEGVGSQLLMIEQNHTLRRLALSSFPKLFTAVTIDPAMLIYLSGANSTKEDPNENYAREMQELFTLGVNGGYTERDVHEHARALTGWTYKWNPTKGMEDFHFDPEQHDDGEKVIYGKRGNFNWQDSIHLVLAHPSHPKHFVTRLWSYFSEEELPERDIRSAEHLYEGSGKEIRPVLEAMLMHPLLHSGPRMVKPPIVQIAGMLRAIGRTIDTSAWVWESEIAGQKPFYPPNVAGWESNRWLNTGTWLARFNLTATMIDKRREIPQSATKTTTKNPKKLVAQASAFWGSPTLSGPTKAALTSYATAVNASAKETWEKEAFPALALGALRSLVAASPDYHTC